MEGDINSIHHVDPKKGGSSLRDAFLKYYSLKTGNKNNNKPATLPSDGADKLHLLSLRTNSPNERW